MAPELSIVIPTYNQGPYILDCLTSIQRQSFKEFEVLIQDSCSTDGTEEICVNFCKLDKRFKYFREKDRGQSDAINRGLGKSEGKFWTWICSDDFYSGVTTIEELINSFKIDLDRSLNVVGVFGNARLVSESGKYVGKYYTYKKNVSRSKFKYSWPFSQPASILLTERVRQNGGVNEDLNLGMDLDLFIRITDTGGYFKYIPAEVASVRIQPGSKSVKYQKITAECALGIIRYYYGDTGVPQFSQYARELANCRLDEIVAKLRKKMKGLSGKTVEIENGQELQEIFTFKDHPIKFFKWWSRRVIVRFLGRIFLSQVPANIPSFEVVKKWNQENRKNSVLKNI